MGLFDRDNQFKARVALRQMRRKANLTAEQKEIVDRALASDEVMDGLADTIEVEQELLARQPQAVGGPIADAFAMLIRDFIENPEKWIKIIMMFFAV